ncbi:MAG TPA: hypothetical protein VIM61_09270 [Chthoniobacterales bacterium]
MSFPTGDELKAAIERGDVRPVLQAQTPYLHGIKIANGAACDKWAEKGEVMSSEFEAITSSELFFKQRGIRNAPFDLLRQPSFTPGLTTPRASFVVSQAAHARAGIPFKLPNGREVNVAGNARLIDLGEVELAFEEMRRALFPNAPSRLCCLWVAEANDAGKKHIIQMLAKGDADKMFVFPVIVVHERTPAKVETFWFNEYYATRDRSCIERYWAGEPRPDGEEPTWEILIEGKLFMIYNEDIEHVRTLAPNWPKP